MNGGPQGQAAGGSLCGLYYGGSASLSGNDAHIPYPLNVTHALFIKITISDGLRQ
jgi:hypothetical protein